MRLKAFYVINFLLISIFFLCSCVGITYKTSDGFRLRGISNVNVYGVIKYEGDKQDIIIPTNYKRKIITTIGGNSPPYFEMLIPACVERITIQNNINNIIGISFYSESNLKEFYVMEDNEHFKSIDGVLYTKDGSTFMAYPPAKSDETLVLSQSVSFIQYKINREKNIYLKNIYFLSENIVDITHYNRFYEFNFPNLENLYVPEYLLEAYKTDGFWSRYADIIKPIPADFDPSAI